LGCRESTPPYALDLQAFVIEKMPGLARHFFIQLAFLGVVLRRGSFAAIRSRSPEARSPSP
jgi:hypothetical protein